MSLSLKFFGRNVVCLAVLAVSGGFAVAEDAKQNGDLFSRLDKNNDGQLAADEVDAGKRSLFDRLVRTADKNKDGKLSREEFAAGTKRPAPPADTPRPARPQFDPQQVFARLDKNGDGKLTKDEAPDRLKENFDRIDANKDGHIAQAELAAAFRRASGQNTPNRRRVTKEMLEKNFAERDTNRDGRVTVDEVPAERREFFLRLSRLAGTSGEKGLTKEQFIQVMTRLAAGQRQTDSPRRPSTTAMASPGAALMRALDTDRDGELSKAELAAASKTLGKLDRNGDGKLSRYELVGGASARPAAASAQARVQFMMRRIMQTDKNGDGKLSRDEAPERMKQNFDRLDANGDGSLDRSEIERLVTRYLQNQRRGASDKKKPTDRD